MFNRSNIYSLTFCVLQSVFDSKGFEELSEDTVCFILASDNLMLDELELYNSIRRWANVNAVSEITVYHSCLSHLLAKLAQQLTP